MKVNIHSSLSRYTERVCIYFIYLYILHRAYLKERRRHANHEKTTKIPLKNVETLNSMQREGWGAFSRTNHGTSLRKNTRTTKRGQKPRPPPSSQLFITSANMISTKVQCVRGVSH